MCLLHVVCPIETLICIQVLHLVAKREEKRNDGKMVIGKEGGRFVRNILEARLTREFLTVLLLLHVEQPIRRLVQSHSETV